MAFAILRIKKVKERGRHGLAAVAAHIARSRETSNADPGRPIETLHGLDPEADVMRLLPDKRRRDATVAVEFLLTASPEFFRPENPEAAGTWHEQRMRRWAELNLAWLRGRYGENLAHAALHLDESTPHIQALVVPLSADGRLTARDLFGPVQLRRLQSEYAGAMAALGLVRGIRGSKARHEPIKKFYARVNQDIGLDLNAPAPPAHPKIRVTEPAARDRLNPQRYAERAANEAYRQGWQEGAEKALFSLRPSIAKARQFDTTRKRLAEREARLSEMQARTERLREIPLRDILLAAGCTPDPRDPRGNWRTPAGRISLSRENPMQWYNHDQGVGGGGAIDLTIHLTGLGFREAIAWLARHFKEDAAFSSARAWAAQRVERAAERAIGLVVPALPRPDPKGIDAVRAYLIKQRHLPAQLIDRAIASGAIYSIRYGKYVNAAFPLNDINGSLSQSVGVEIQGIGEDPFHGTRGNDGVFLFGEDAMLEVALCDGAIDALSYLALHRRRAGLWVAAVPNHDVDLVGFALRHADKGIKVTAAFARRLHDRQTQGALALAALPSTTRDTPREAADWNDLLRLSVTANCLFPAERARPGPVAKDDPKFVRVGDRWVWFHEPGRTAITDHELFFTIEDFRSEALGHALVLARQRWDSIIVRGSSEFLTAVRKSASALAVEVVEGETSAQEQWIRSVTRQIGSAVNFQPLRFDTSTSVEAKEEASHAIQSAARGVKRKS